VDGCQLTTVDAAKIKILWCSSHIRSLKYPVSHFLFVAVLSSSHPSFLIWVCDNTLSMKTVHITKVDAGCFTTLRQLCNIRQSLSQEFFIRLVMALVLPRLDYCNGGLAGLSANQLSHLQCILHAAAWLI